MDAEKRRDPCGHTVLCPSARQNSYLSLLSLDIAGFFSAYFSTLPVFFLRTLPAELCKLFERTSRNISFGCPS